MLDHHAPVHGRAVTRLVAVGVVGVHGVGHVGRDDERPLHGALHGALLPRAQGARHASDRVEHHGAARPHRGLAAHLLVVEQRHGTHRLLLLKPRRGQQGVQGTAGGVGAMLRMRRPPLRVI